MSDDRERRPDPREADPGRPPRPDAPGGEKPPVIPGPGEMICPECTGWGRLKSGEVCETCEGTGVVLAGGGY